jgi:serine/threonine protein kinase
MHFLATKLLSCECLFADWQVGTLVCMAPEVISSTPASKYDGVKSDIWSCGVMLYWMLFGTTPFPPDPAAKTDMERNQSLLLRITEGWVRCFILFLTGFECTHQKYCL